MNKVGSRTKKGVGGMRSHRHVKEWSTQSDRGREDGREESKLRLSG